MNYAFTHATLLDGTKDMELRPEMTVLVERDRISSISHGYVLPAGFQEIDLRGRYLLPGLIDLHVHLAGSGKPLPSGGGDGRLKARIMKSMETGILHRAVVKRVRKSLETKLNSGVTTVRAVGDIGWSDIENRDLIRSGQIIGPNLLASGVAISVPGGHMSGSIAVACQDKEACIKAAAAAISHKSDFIKLMVSGGVLDASDDGEPARLRMPYEMVKVTCDEAHANGYKVAAHAESPESVKVALKAGVDSIEHGAVMDAETIGLYKQNGSSVTVTISPAIAIARLPGELTGMDTVQQICAEKVLNGIIESGKQALENNIPVGLGTDSSCPFITQYDMWREVCYFSRFCNVEPAFALHTATLGNARILGVGNDTGSVEVGKLADLIVTRCNPLTDLRALREIDMVMCRGRLIAKPRVRHMKKIDLALDGLL